MFIYNLYLFVIYVAVFSFLALLGCYVADKIEASRPRGMARWKR